MALGNFDPELVPAAWFDPGVVDSFEYGPFDDSLIGAAAPTATVVPLRMLMGVGLSWLWLAASLSLSWRSD